MIYYVDNSNIVSSFANNAEFKIYLRIYGDKNGLREITEAEAIAIANSTLTQEQRIFQIRKQYDKEIRKVCNSNLLNSINSARNLSTIETSPLQEIAKKITDWELEQQIIFVKLLDDAENGIILFDENTFDENFIKFNKDT